MLTTIKAIGSIMVATPIGWAAMAGAMIVAVRVVIA